MIYLRQICLVAKDLAPVVDDLAAVFSIAPCYVDEAVAEFGLENTLLPVGTNFLEVVAPVETGTPADRFLDRRGGDGGYMVICQAESADEQDAARRRAAENDVRVAFEASHDGWQIMQLHPRDMGAAFLEIDWHRRTDVTGHWGPAGGTAWQDHVSTDVVAEIIGAELQADDPDAMAAHWATIAGVTAEGRSVRLGNATLRFVPAADGRGPGLSGVDIRAADPARLLTQAENRQCRVADDQVMIGGTRFYIAA